jgi:hypothetical protein
MGGEAIQILREPPKCRRSEPETRCRAQAQRVARLSFLQISGPRLARRDRTMHKAYIIEVDDEAVGIAARDRGGFRFHSALHALNGLDGRLFPTVLDATRAARALVDRDPPRTRRVERAF